ncbi:MAG: hypothetical protein IJX90_11240 [Blautia sp.]|nr:hypothetical protein [Blautia sp.]
MTLNEFYPQYRRSLSSRMNDISIRTHCSNLINHLLKDFGDVELTEVTVQDMISLLERIENSHLSHNSVIGVRSAIRCFFHHAKQMGFIPLNPVLLAQKAMKPQQKPAPVHNQGGI